MFIRDRITRKELDLRIENFKRLGKDIIVIDDWMLSTHKKLYSKCSRVYVVTRNSIERRNGVLSRDQLTLSEINVMDLPFALKYVQMPTGNNVIEVKNGGTIEDLKSRMEEEYLDIGVMGFDERHRITDEKTLAQIRKVGRTLTKANELIYDKSEIKH